MANTYFDNKINNLRITLELLNSLGRNSGTSQRRLAAELGIALGLVNTYLKRCVKKGLVKASQAPARRYAYYLTPQGFAEKSKLTVEYLSHSLGFFRAARADCAQLLRDAVAAGRQRIVLAGISDIAEIMIISAMECDIEIVAVVDPRASSSFAGREAFPDFDKLMRPFDAVIVTDLLNIDEVVRAMVERFGQDRVLVPNILRQQTIASGTSP